MPIAELSFFNSLSNTKEMKSSQMTTDTFKELYPNSHSTQGHLDRNK